MGTGSQVFDLPVLWALRVAIFGIESEFLPALREKQGGTTDLPGSVEQGSDDGRPVDLARIGVDPAVVHRAFGNRVELFGLDPDVAQTASAARAPRSAPRPPRPPARRGGRALR